LAAVPCTNLHALTAVKRTFSKHFIKLDLQNTEVSYKGNIEDSAYGTYTQNTIQEQFNVEFYAFFKIIQCALK